MTEHEPDDPSGPRCPSCGTPGAVEIVYGEPTPETFDAAERGEIVLGGCAVELESPTHQCRRCGERFIDTGNR